ncbi:ABC transporter permease [Paucibacter sp. B2R-40]|uniref:ABC transporter permease n=1 Tax=Paucibacter sp. B2R-40 TaxID=2893554 RepID=UPI0021E3CFFB|nr:FtsX-like permease family protein [Paucibacter sp. B2R-40]MCV2356901.1 ABC transporter permease [Paucibacter sp. B2R-40]
MRLLDLRVAARQLRAEPLNATVLIVGLALALAVCYLLAVLLGERMRPDPALQEPERIVMIDFHGNMPGRQEDWFLGAPFVFKQALQEAQTPLSLLTRISDDTLTLRQGERKLRANVSAADASLVALFNLRSLQGDLKAALSRPDTIALTQSLAQQLFGSEAALGRSVDIGQHRLTVAAILPQPSSLSLLRAEAFISFDSPAAGLDEETRNAWFQISGQVFARLALGASAAQVGAVAQTLLDQSPVIKQLPPDWTAGGRKAAFMRALPITQLPFEGRAGRQRLMVLSALAGVAGLLLCLALMNCVNLSSVRTLRRQREIAVRKSLGISPLRLLWQFAVEAQLSIALAAGLGLLLAWLGLPWAVEALQVPPPDSFLQLLPLAGLGLACMILTLLVCVYPAWLAWRMQAAAALQGRQASEGEGGRWLRRGLTTLQFGLALLVGTLALSLAAQNRHVLARDLGFAPEGVLSLRLPAGAGAEQAEDFYQALRLRPEVQAQAWSDSVPGNTFMDRNAEFTQAEHHAKLRFNYVNAAFFGLYKIPLLAGRLDDAAAAGLVLDEPAVRALGWARPEQALGQTLSYVMTGLNQGQSSWQVVAVVPQQLLESTREAARPHAFLMHNGKQNLGDVRAVLNLRLRPGSQAETVLAPLWTRYFPNEPFAFETAEQTLMAGYQADLRIGHLVSACGLLALALAGFGVYALAAYLVQRHGKEIVLRKLHGASGLQAMKQPLREFAALLACAAALTLPLTWYLGEQYLTQFVDRVQLGVWPQLLALAGLLAVTLLASLRHGMAALAMRPILALRD